MRAYPSALWKAEGDVPLLVLRLLESCDKRTSRPRDRDRLPTIIGAPHKGNIFLRPVLVKALERFGKYPSSPEKASSYWELRTVVEDSGLLVLHRTGLLAFSGVLRMAELFSYKRQIPLYRLSPLVLWPFDCLETRWRWPGFFGCLIALVAEKVPS